MKIESIRGEFKVYTVVPEEMALKDDLYQFLRDVGFNVKSFSKAEAVLSNLVQEPPHIIISYLNLPQMDGLTFLENIQQMSDDILMLMVTSNDADRNKALQQGAYDVIGEDVQERYLISLLDRVIEKLYLKFQNEQLLEELNRQIQSNLETHVAGMKTKDTHQDKHTSETNSESEVNLNKNKSVNKKTIDMINQFITKLSVVDNTNDAIDCFIQNMSDLVGQPVIYLKYIPSHTSLLVTRAYNLDINKFKNAGILFEGEPRVYLKKIQNPGTFQQLQEFMSSVFQLKSYSSFPIVVNNNVLGLIVVFDSLSGKLNHVDIVESYVHIFNVFLKKIYFQEKAQDLIVSDLHTGAYNKKYFMKILDQEMSRAYRIKHPLSLLYIDVDDFDNYVERNGEQVGHVLLRMIAHTFIKTSRKIDWISKWQKGEFVMVLPHTDKERAMIKAERLRRMVLNTKFPYSNYQPLGHLSISIGISEYPSLSWDATSLIQVADNALYQVKKSTKNRTCLGVASKEFKPDFKIISAVQN